MGKKTIVLDTNVIISAFGWGGTPRKAFLKAIDHTVYTSEHQLRELARALAYHKLDLSHKQQKRVLAFMRTATRVIKPTFMPTQARDYDDNHILAIAHATQADYLITGDKDLLALKSYKHTKVVTPKEFLNI